MHNSGLERERLTKFVLVGLIGTGLDLTCFLLCLALGVETVVSRVVGYLAGTSWAFFLNRSWVFKSRRRWAVLIPFTLTYLISGSLAVVIQALGPQRPEPLHALLFIYTVSVFVASAVNYLSLRFIVFKM